MRSLPFELLLIIGKYLDPCQIMCMLLVCKNWWPKTWGFPDFQNALKGSKFLRFNNNCKMPSLVAKIKVRKVIPVPSKIEPFIVQCDVDDCRFRLGKFNCDYYPFVIVLQDRILLVNSIGISEDYLAKRFGVKVKYFHCSIMYIDTVSFVCGSKRLEWTPEEFSQF